MKTFFVKIGGVDDTALWNTIARKYHKLAGQISCEAGTRCGKKCGAEECLNPPHPTEEKVCAEGKLWEVIETPTPEQVQGNRVIGNLPVPLAALAAEYYQLSGEEDNVELIRFVTMTYTNWCRATGMPPSSTWEWPQDD